MSKSRALFVALAFCGWLSGCDDGGAGAIDMPSGNVDLASGSGDGGLAKFGDVCTPNLYCRFLN